MARREVDREDILREATALVLRAEVAVPGFNESVIIGFRKDGCGSIYIGADPVYQFNSQFQLRRGYLQGKMIKADGGSLVLLERQRQSDRVELVSHAYSRNQTQELLHTLQHDIKRLRDAFCQNTVNVVGQVPENDDVVAAIKLWLQSIPDDIEIARAPNAR